MSSAATSSTSVKCDGKESGEEASSNCSSPAGRSMVRQDTAGKLPPHPKVSRLEDGSGCSPLRGEFC